MAIVRLAYKLSEGANYIDLAQSISLTERRLVHQKQVFTVIGGMIVDDTSHTLVKIATAPNNFYTRNAVTRGFRAWKKSRAKALEAAGDSADDITAKYADFKVYLDQGGTSPLRPFTAGSDQLNAGEWVFSKIVPEGGPEKSFMIVGRDHTASIYSLSKGWLETRPVPQQDPEMPDLDSDQTADYKNDFLNTMFQDTTEDADRLNRISTAGDNAPYPYGTLMTTQEAYSANSPNNLQLQFISHSGGLNEVNTAVPGFQALCGLIRIDIDNDQEVADPFLIIDVETKGWNF
jgi:hypothetical protein